ncbi:hypothetical protein [Parapedobacter indicus]|uniref:Uncharacterized protein n=1 Tax=Parapedobacter indicus TaxID=1477437 RepID=A0A1I3E5P5_9SPHI|nr:hypothetical protein [Parapedobacter indicus]PPL04970.1 hypothetical protein CLV26_101781 [Parapedobacter indicus]SFH94031.1 hypothetical protein SAMN05444682_101767 [Parapedobacter indicus]
MKEKILAALKTKHADTIKSLGLGEKALLGIAAMLAITVTEESQIETVVSSDGVAEALKGVQGEVDGRVTAAVKKATEKKPDGGDGDNTKPKKEDPNDKGDEDDVKSLLKTLVKQNETLTAEINNIKQEKTTKTLNQRITDKLKEAKVDDDYITDQLDGRTFNSEDEADAFITKATESWGKLQQKFANEKLAEGAEKPFITNSTGESDFITNLKAAAATAVPKEN